MRGRRVAIVTSTGGAATLVADSAGAAGFDTPAPDAATARNCSALDIRDAVLDRNPIDVTLAGLRPDLLRTVIDTLLASPTYDAVIVIVGSSGIGQPDLVARPVIEALAKSDKPLLVYVSPDAPQIVRHLNRQRRACIQRSGKLRGRACGVSLERTATPASTFSRAPAAAPPTASCARRGLPVRGHVERSRKQTAVCALRHPERRPKSSCDSVAEAEQAALASATPWC